ncbi:MAG TPA: hypothetical protein VFQ88_05700 [Nevskiaceae bacterium]|nr:hypothetical protein [Nevskiaceae bacterium]
MRRQAEGQALVEKQAQCLPRPLSYMLHRSIERGEIKLEPGTPQRERRASPLRRHVVRDALAGHEEIAWRAPVLDREKIARRLQDWRQRSQQDASMPCMSEIAREADMRLQTVKNIARGGWFRCGRHSQVALSRVLCVLRYVYDGQLDPLRDPEPPYEPPAEDIYGDNVPF